MRLVCWQVLGVGLLLMLPGFARANDTPAPTPTPVPARELVRHIGTVTGVADSFVIPMDPPIVSSRMTATGQATVLGKQLPVTMVGHSLILTGVDGMPLSTDGLNVFSYPDGSAVFVRTNALIKPSPKPGFLAYEGTWTATGGKGMFLGASGSGIWSGEIEVATGMTTASWDGMDMLLSSVVKAITSAGQ
jgi:hypothetical protein